MAFPENSFSQPPNDPFSPIDFRAELNDDQYAAVTAPQGPALVLAGAGSGKTRTLTYRVAYLLSQGVWPSEILLLTFTNKSAKEMLSRVEELTGIPTYKFWGGTFHGIGQRILRVHGEEIGLEKNFTILDQNDAEALLGEAVRDINPAFVKDKSNPKPRVINDIISYARNTCQTLGQTITDKYPWFDDIREDLKQFATAYNEKKRKQQVCDYDDLLELWLKLLNEHEEIAAHYQQRFKNILVDEYQDTNHLQSQIIDKLAANHQVMAVGDDAQCIYTWRGADIENITEFPQRHPGTQIYKIETNYRSSPQILDFANNVLEHQPIQHGFNKKLNAVKPAHQRPFILPAIDTRQQATLVLRRIQGILDEGYSLKDVAILYRAHYHAMDIQMELSRQAIPYTITSGVRFFEQAHVRDLVAQLRFVNNPQDSSAFYRVAMLLPKVGGKTAERLFKLVEKQSTAQHKSPVQVLTADSVVAKVPAVSKDDWIDLAKTLQQMEDAMGGPAIEPPKPEADLFTAAENPVKREREAQHPKDIVQIAIDGWYGDFMRGHFENWRTRKDDLDSLLGFAERYESMNELLAQLVLLNSETSDRAIDPEQDTIKLTTIHQAKGLEYPIVFILGLADGLFPLKRSIEGDNLEEERRLFYVSVTRAMKELYLLYPRVSNQGGPPTLMEPSRFLKEVEDTHYEIVRTSQY